MVSGRLMQSNIWRHRDSSADRDSESGHLFGGHRRAYSPRERLAFDRFAAESDDGTESPEINDDGFDPNDILSELNNYAIHRPDNSGSSSPKSFRTGRFNMLQRNRVYQSNVELDDPDAALIHDLVVARPHDILRSLRGRRLAGFRMVERDTSSDSESAIWYDSSCPPTRCPSETRSIDSFSDGLDSSPSSPDFVL
jgi:hypothetical protein